MSSLLRTQIRSKTGRVHQVLIVQYTQVFDVSGASCQTHILDTTVGAVKKKRKRNLRKNRTNANVQNAGPSLVHPLRLLGMDDEGGLGLGLTLSNLLGRHGIPQNRFFEAFHTCETCGRIVCNEISRINGHICVIEILDD